MTADRPDEEASGGEKLGLAGVGIALFAIVCCAGLPLIAGGVASSIAIGAVLGVGAGILALAALVALVVIWAQRRRKRACEAPERERLSARGELP